jgi:hypothetical protein
MFPFSAQKMECFSETLASTCESTRRQNPEENHHRNILISKQTVTLPLLTDSEFRPLVGNFGKFTFTEAVVGSGVRIFTP